MSTLEGLDDDCITESSDIYNRLTLRVKYQNPYVGHTESLTNGGGPSYCSGPTMDDSSHQRKNNSHINRFKPGKVCKRNNDELQIILLIVEKLMTKTLIKNPIYTQSLANMLAKKRVLTIKSKNNRKLAEKR